MPPAGSTIWTYRNHFVERARLQSLIRSDDCVFCNAAMDVIMSDGDISGSCGDSITRSMRIRCCQTCGWWSVRKTEFTTCGGENTDDEWGNAGILKTLDVSDQTLPIASVRSYLTVKYDDRFKVNPTVFEHVVASVFRDLGFRVRVTGRSGDEGIDVILEGPH